MRTMIFKVLFYFLAMCEKVFLFFFFNSFVWTIKKKDKVTWAIPCFENPPYEPNQKDGFNFQNQKEDTYTQT